MEVLRHFGVTRIRLMTNNPLKVIAAQESGITVVERIGIEIASNDSSKKYLRTKKDKLGHILSSV
jgi:3,4-dihydroxy 2-butanone 4-phosphate synthase/GTP cyclohydrolase II